LQSVVLDVADAFVSQVEVGVLSEAERRGLIAGSLDFDDQFMARSEGIGDGGIDVTDRKFLFAVASGEGVIKSPSQWPDDPLLHAGRESNESQMDARSDSLPRH
jgi:hypothetical protein